MSVNVKNLILKFGVFFLPLFVLCSCEDDSDMEQYDIRIVAVADQDVNTEAVSLYGALESGSYLPFISQLDFEFTRTCTDGFIYNFAAYCGNPDTRINIKVWVNGEFAGEVEGYSRVYIRQLINDTEVNTDFTGTKQ